MFKSSLIISYPNHKSEINKLHTKIIFLFLIPIIKIEVKHLMITFINYHARYQT